MAASIPGEARPGAAARAAAVRRVLLSVLYLNLLMVAVKVVAYASSSALSVLAEVTHSLLDAANNLLALWITRVAAQGPDAEHPYGHQKFETLGALALVGLLSVTVFELVRSALRALLADAPPAVEGTPLAMALMSGSVLVGLVVVGYESRRGRALGSDLLLADAAHTRSDVFTTLAVLGGLVLTQLGFPRADPLLALIVAAIIAHAGWQIVRRSVPVLVDERAVDPAHIQYVAEAAAGVISSYGIRSRGRPEAVFVELTIAVDPSLDVQRSHEIADEVERQVTRALDARDVLVHVEPADGLFPRRAPLRRRS